MDGKDSCIYDKRGAGVFIRSSPDVFHEVGARMKADEVYELLNKFIENDFKHLRSKVDWMLYTLIGGLVTIITGLIILLCQ